MTLYANAAQEEAINTINGPVLIISCPGSGKTTTLVRRIHHMIEEGVKPSSILMVTFTRDAAEGMDRKYRELFSTNPGITFATIHSLCFTILKNEGVCRQGSVLSEEKKISFLAEYIRSQYRMRDSWDVAISAATAISMIKNNKISPSQCSISGLPTEILERSYEAYEKKRTEMGLVDFDDMLLLCHETLANIPSILTKYQDMFHYVQCDEYQDTNFVQRDILYLLTEKSQNLCVVGDDDQSIYAFRGARPEIMLSFQKDFPNAKAIRMGTNYRSAAKVVELSDRLIGHNRIRFKKNFISQRGSDGTEGTYTATRFPGKKEEMDYIVKEINRLHEQGIPYKEMAILFRTNQQAQWPARALSEAGIPYFSTENVRSIYEGFIFADIRDYVMLSAGLGDVRQLRNILNHPNRYLYEYYFKDCDYTEDSLMDACSYILNDKGAHWKYEKALDSVAELMRAFGPGEVDMNTSPEEVMSRMNGPYPSVHYDKYLREYADMREMDYTELLDIYKTLEDDAKKYGSVREWFAAADETVRKLHEELKHKDKNGVVVTTMHRAKGLEWQAVFVIDADEALTPHKNSLNDDAAIEEERRLFYVAMTRAKDDLYILGSGPQSRFLNELKDLADDSAKTVEPPVEIPKYFAGKAVEHKRYGKGRVVRYEPGSIVVKFEKQMPQQEKTFTFPEAFRVGHMWYC